MILRRSNIELFRIVSMLLIVCHHYVVNSGLFQLIESNPHTLSAFFLSLFGMWGKTGINCFVLITGYFMCLSQITSSKFIKLLLEIIYYNLVIYLVFALSGYISFSIKDLFSTFFPIRNINTDFTGAFLLYYLFIPFINKLAEALSKTEHGLLIVLCFLIYCIGARLNAGFYIQTNYLSWFIILHLIASYIRFYGVYKEGDSVFWGLLTVFSVLVSALSVIISLNNGQEPYRFVEDSNAPLATITSICAFIWFKGLKNPDSQLINQIAAGTFGVLLIHANSYPMRHWLWIDTLKNVSFFDAPYFHAIGSAIAVFVVCNILDYLRRLFLEPPIMSIVNNKVLPKINIWIHSWTHPSQ